MGVSVGEAPVQPVQTGLDDFEGGLPPKPASDPVQYPAQNVEPVPTAAEIAEASRLEKLEIVKQDFTRRVLEARNPEVKPPSPQPVAPRMLAQTQLEMELGAKMNTHHAELRAKGPTPRALSKNEATMTPVFRPADYVPDQKKGQGYLTGTRTL